MLSLPTAPDSVDQKLPSPESAHCSPELKKKTIHYILAESKTNTQLGAGAKSNTGYILFCSARASFCTSRCPFAHLRRMPLRWRVCDIVVAMCRKECTHF